MFRTEYKVKISDINYGNHMGNQIPLELFHQVRMEFLTKEGLSELNIGDGVGTIQRESWIKYNKEVFFGETLTLEIEDIIIERVSMIIKYNVLKENGENAVEGTTTMLGYSYENKKVSKIPDSFKNLVEKYKK